MNKGKNCFFAILVFGLTMAVFNGMSVVLAVSASIGGGIIQGANGVNMTYDYLMDHMNFYSVLVYLIPLAIFGLWYYFAFVDQKGTENSLSVKIKKLDITGCLILVIFTFSIQHVTSLVMAVINQLFPQAMETYTEMIDSSGITEYSLMWVVSTLILPPLVEEMIFRGLIMGYLRRTGMHWMITNVIQAVCFGIFHQNLVQGIYAGLLGLALGYVAYRYGTLFASMLMHLLYNLFGTVLIDIESSIMPDWMLGLLIFLCVPLTVVGIVLVYIKTVNTDKKQESKI